MPGTRWHWKTIWKPFSDVKIVPGSTLDSTGWLRVQGPTIQLCIRCQRKKGIGLCKERVASATRGDVTEKKRRTREPTFTFHRGLDSQRLHLKCVLFAPIPIDFQFERRMSPRASAEVRGRCSTDRRVLRLLPFSVDR